MQMYFTYQKDPKARIIDLSAQVLRTVVADPKYDTGDKMLSKRTIEYILKYDLMTKEEFMKQPNVIKNTIPITDVRVDKGVYSYYLKAKYDSQDRTITEAELERSYVELRDAYNYYLERIS